MADTTILDPLSRFNIFKKTLMLLILKKASNNKPWQTSNRLWLHSHSWETSSLQKIKLTSSSKQTWHRMISTLRAKNFHQLYFQNLTMTDQGLSMNKLGRLIRSKTSRMLHLSPQTLRFNQMKVMRAFCEIISWDQGRPHLDLVLQT